MKRCFALALWAVGLVTSLPARADQAEARRQAQDTFNAGLRFYTEAEQTHDPKLYEAAYLKFAQTFAIYPDKHVLWNLAVSEIDTKRFVEGLHHLRAYDAYEHVLLQPGHRRHKLFREYLDRALRATARITVTAPAGAKVRVDGVDVGSAPLAGAVDVMPGDHSVEAEIDGTARKMLVSVAAGQTASVDVSPPPPSPSPAAPSPSPPPALAPAPAAATAAQPPAPAPIVAARPETPSAPKQGEYWTPMRTWGAILGAVGVVAFGVGGLFALQTRQEADQASALSTSLGPTGCSSGDAPACQQLRSVHDAQSLDFALTATFLGAGGAALVTGAALLLWPRRAAATTALVPMLSPRAAGVQLRGEL